MSRATAHGHYGDRHLKLDSHLFQREVMRPDDKEIKNNGTWIIFFSARWCMHCKEFQPIWDDFLKHLDDLDEPGYRAG